MDDPSSSEVLQASQLPSSTNRSNWWFRRAFVFGGAILITVSGGILMGDLLWRLYGSFNGASAVLLGIFLILFGLLSFGIMTALVGFFIGGTGGAKVNPAAGLTQKDLEAPFSPTVIVYPVYNENPIEIFERIRAVFRSIERTGRLDDFEFFVLSDSTNPENWIQEEFAWLQLCRELKASGRIHYRRRLENIDKKAGNISEFLQTWGGRYTNMVVMDADSVMAGEDMVKMAALMEKHPRIGLLQTAPRLARAASIHGRVQQFAFRLLGDMFTAGLNYWQGPSGNYWGHNAIIRLAPFAEFCALPDLPGKEPFGGKILSHDFVEAALMRKAGWEIWLLWDLEGSWEEGPPSLIESAKRDRRWLQGNLQHTWLLFASGIHPVSRLHLLLGIVGYLSSPLWFLFLLINSLIVFNQVVTGLTLVPAESALGAYLPVAWSTNQQGLIIFGATLLLLFLPKILAFLQCLFDWKRARRFGGIPALIGGLLIETLYSALVAPIVMLFHTKFFFWLLLGRKVEWVTQQRDAVGNSWREAFGAHAGQMFLGMAWLTAAFLIEPMLGYWLLPVFGPVALAVPISVWGSRPTPGARLRRANLLATPEETAPPLEYREIIAREEKGLSTLSDRFDPNAELEGITRVIVDPYVNAVHVSLIKKSAILKDPASVEELAQLKERLIYEGPAGLDQAALRRLANSTELMLDLHRLVWLTPFADLSPWWQHAVEYYRRGA